MSEQAMTRRLFLNRGALLAAGGLALPMWAQWLGEQMDKIRPRKRVMIYNSRHYRAAVHWRHVPEHEIASVIESFKVYYALAYITTEDTDQAT